MEGNRSSHYTKYSSLICRSFSRVKIAALRGQSFPSMSVENYIFSRLKHEVQVQGLGNALCLLSIVGQHPRSSNKNHHFFYIVSERIISKCRDLANAMRRRIYREYHANSLCFHKSSPSRAGDRRFGFDWLDFPYLLLAHYATISLVSKPVTKSIVEPSDFFVLRMSRN